MPLQIIPAKGADGLSYPIQYRQIGANFWALCKAVFGSGDNTIEVADSDGFRMPVKVADFFVGNSTLAAALTIAAADLSQQLFAANATRKAIQISNPPNDDAGIPNNSSIWIQFGAVATADHLSIEIVPGGSYEFPASIVDPQSVNIICHTINYAFQARQW